MILVVGAGFEHCSNSHDEFDAVLGCYYQNSLDRFGSSWAGWRVRVVYWNTNFGKEALNSRRHIPDQHPGALVGNVLKGMQMSDRQKNE